MSLLTKILKKLVPLNKSFCNRASRRAFQQVIETADDGAGSAVARYWLLLLHLKKNDLAASQVDYQHTVLFMNSFGTRSPLYNKLAKLIVCCRVHLLLFFSFDLLGSFVQSKVRWK